MKFTASGENVAALRVLAPFNLDHVGDRVLMFTLVIIRNATVTIVSFPVYFLLCSHHAASDVLGIFFPPTFG
jgi:hypothetical protein